MNIGTDIYSIFFCQVTKLVDYCHLVSFQTCIYSISQANERAVEIEEEAIAKVAELETHLSEVSMECDRLKVGDSTSQSSLCICIFWKNVNVCY